MTVEAISRPLGRIHYWLVRVDGVVVGRVVDRTPYVPVEWGTAAQPIQGTSPAARRFEAQQWSLDEGEFVEGPLFLTMELAAEFLVE